MQARFSRARSPNAGRVQPSRAAVPACTNSTPRPPRGRPSRAALFALPHRYIGRGLFLQFFALLRLPPHRAVALKQKTAGLAASSTTETRKNVKNCRAGSPASSGGARSRRSCRRCRGKRLSAHGAGTRRNSSKCRAHHRCRLRTQHRCGAPGELLRLPSRAGTRRAAH